MKLRRQRLGFSCGLILLIWLFISGSILPAYCEEERNPLIGSWTLQSISGGDPGVKAFRIEWEFTQDEVIVRSHKYQEEVSRHKYTVDFSRSPAWITVTFGEPATETRLGIFRIHGDELHLLQRIGVGERPKDFKEGYSALRRVRKPADE